MTDTLTSSKARRVLASHDISDVQGYFKSPVILCYRTVLHNCICLRTHLPSRFLPYIGGYYVVVPHMMLMKDSFSKYESFTLVYNAPTCDTCGHPSVEIYQAEGDFCYSCWRARTEPYNHCS